MTFWMRIKERTNMITRLNAICSLSICMILLTWWTPCRQRVPISSSIAPLQSFSYHILFRLLLSFVRLCPCLTLCSYVIILSSFFLSLLRSKTPWVIPGNGFTLSQWSSLVPFLWWISFSVSSAGKSTWLIAWFDYLRVTKPVPPSRLILNQMEVGWRIIIE